MESATNQRGIALIGIVVIMAILMGLAATMAISVNMDTQLRGAFGHSMTGFYAAEAGLNRGMGEFKNIFLDFNVPTSSDFAQRTLSIAGRTVNYSLSERAGNPRAVTIPLGELFGGLNSIQYNYTVNSAALGPSSDEEAAVGAEFLVGNIPLFQFVAFYKKDLEIAPGRDMVLNGRVHSNGDLYLSADGAALVVQDSPLTPTVQVSAQGAVYRGRKRENMCDSGGTVTVDKLEDLVAPFNDLDPLGLNCSGAPSVPAKTSSGGTRKVPVSELAQWKGGLVSQIQSISVPEPGNQADGNGEYWKRADLRIVLNLKERWVPVGVGLAPGQVGYGNKGQFVIEVRKADRSRDEAKTTILRQFMTGVASTPGGNATRPLFYTDVPNAAGCNCSDGKTAAFTCNNNKSSCYDPPFINGSDNRVYGTGTWMTTDADYRRGGFYNFRERKWMYLLNLNVRDLLTWNMNQPSSSRLFDPADRTDGGIVLFLSVDGPNASLSANNYGVRIFGSATLPFPNMGSDPTGITIASDQAVYVQGNYNSAATIAAGRQPSAIIADSLNVLSNAWWQAQPVANTRTNDCQSTDDNGSGNRNATATIVNTAFLGGVDDTGPGAGSSGYNGGLENYPRFHENWGGIDFNYLGSMVSLGNPTHVTGKWADQMYSPPRRNWNYDQDLNDAAYLPPLTPRFVYVQQVLFTEDFK